MGKIITSVATFSELADANRRGSVCIPVTFLSGVDACVPHPFFGSLVAEDGEYLISLRSMAEGSDRIAFKLRWSESDKDNIDTELDCILDGHLGVKLKGAWVDSTNLNSITGVILNFRFNEIVCSNGDGNKKNTNDILMISKIAYTKLNYKNVMLATKTECSLDGEIGESTKRNALGGDIPPYRYKIQQDGEDLTLSVKLLEGNSSPSSESDLGFMSALFQTFIWINGGHPYAYYRAHNRDGFTVEAALQPVRRNPRCNNSLICGDRNGIVATAILECGINFFRAESDLVKDLRLFLEHYREATAEGPITMGMLLQASSLLEGVIGLTLRYPMGLSKSAIKSLEFPGDMERRKGTALARFYHAIDFLGFDWANQVESVFSKWKIVRNALAHGELAELEKHEAQAIIEAYCQIIQAFNAISLRLIGYRGNVRLDKGWFAA